MNLGYGIAWAQNITNFCLMQVLKPRVLQRMCRLLTFLLQHLVNRLEYFLVYRFLNPFIYIWSHLYQETQDAFPTSGCTLFIKYHQRREQSSCWCDDVKIP